VMETELGCDRPDLPVLAKKQAADLGRYQWLQTGRVCQSVRCYSW
jgi:hypothetical protein